MTTTSSPGKIILTGEHAILAGCPALAMATTPRVRCITSARKGSSVTLHLPGRKPHTLSCTELAAESGTTLGQHKKGDLPSSPEALLFTAAHHLAPGWAGEIRFATTLPLGSGMGASAAFLLSLSQALCPELSPADRYMRVLELEHLQHGRSSGLDVWTSLQGGLWWIEDTERIPISVSSLPEFTLFHTGTPSATTGECVTQVQQQVPRGHGIWSEFDQVIRHTRQAVLGQDGTSWSTCIRENHQLLCRIGVVPTAVQRDIRTIERAGGAAKVCGAGSVHGTTAGMVMVRDADPETIPEHWSDIRARFCTSGTS